MDRPYIWQMIREAINSFDGSATYPEIKNYINQKWENINQDTITAQIIALTVNHDSRGHYPENRNPRLTNSNSPYDLLFSIDRGTVVKYDVCEHGIWELYFNDTKKLDVRQFSFPTKTYTPSDIVWIKNVTNQIDGEAYLDLSNDRFVLDFPTKHKSNVLSPAIDELILIRQKVNGIPAFTHLVTPVDNVLLPGDKRTDYQYGRLVKVIAKSNNQNYIPVQTTLWKRLKYGGITQGNACRIVHIKNVGNIDELLLDIWQRFNEYFTEAEKQSQITTSAIITEIESTNPDITVTEGELKLVSHYVKERNQKIVGQKKRDAIKNNCLKCEVCTFSFPATYGATFIECHHITPISQTSVRETTLEDLSLVCSNCHRMLHIKFQGEYLSIKELQERIQSLKLSIPIL